MPGLGTRRGAAHRNNLGAGVDFAPGATIYGPDKPAEHIYLLRAGGVQLCSGREAVIDYLVPGDFFGEQCLQTGSGRPQLARSLSPIEVSIFARSELLDRVRKDRRFARRLLTNMAVRMYRLEQTIRDFVAAPAEYRLARLLLRFAPSRATSGWVKLRFSPSNSDLARTVGTTRSRVAHFMSRFQRLGWLRRRPDLWVDYEALRHFVESRYPETE
jgi:CRP-like cAMP-binding protein